MSERPEPPRVQLWGIYDPARGWWSFSVGYLRGLCIFASREAAESSLAATSIDDAFVAPIGDSSVEFTAPEPPPAEPKRPEWVMLPGDEDVCGVRLANVNFFAIADRFGGNARMDIYGFGSDRPIDRVHGRDRVEALLAALGPTLDLTGVEDAS